MHSASSFYARIYDRFQGKGKDKADDTQRKERDSGKHAHARRRYHHDKYIHQRKEPFARRAENVSAQRRRRRQPLFARKTQHGDLRFYLHGNEKRTGKNEQQGKEQNKKQIADAEELSVLLQHSENPTVRAPASHTHATAAMPAQPLTFKNFPAFCIFYPHPLLIARRRPRPFAKDSAHHRMIISIPCVFRFVNGKRDFQEKAAIPVGAAANFYPFPRTVSAGADALIFRKGISAIRSGKTKDMLKDTMNVTGSYAIHGIGSAKLKLYRQPTSHAAKTVRGVAKANEIKAIARTFTRYAARIFHKLTTSASKLSFSALSDFTERRSMMPSNVIATTNSATPTHVIATNTPHGA